MELARRLGVAPNQVAVVDPTLAQPLVPTDTAEAATKVGLQCLGALRGDHFPAEHVGPGDLDPGGRA